jgi:hypothetical protein
MVLINRCFDQLNMWCPAHGKPCRAQRLFAGQAGFWRCDLRRNRCRSLGCRSHSFPAILLLMLSMCVPAICETGQSCSWLNAASAAGVLQGPVTATVTHTSQNKDDATCEFIRRDGSVVTELQIEVETMRDRASDFASYRALCGPNAAPLRAIGNEALVCSLHGNKHNEPSARPRFYRTNSFERALASAKRASRKGSEGRRTGSGGLVLNQAESAPPGFMTNPGQSRARLSIGCRRSGGAWARVDFKLCFG